MEMNCLWSRLLKLNKTINIAHGFFPIIIIIIDLTALYEPWSYSKASSTLPYLMPNFSNSSLLQSWCHGTHSPHLSLGLQALSFPSGLVLNILLFIRLLSIRMTCPANFSVLIFMYLTKSGSSYNLYNSKLYLLLHYPLSRTAPKILLRIFLANSSSSALSSAF
jgi:hypothetical protein